MGPALRERRVQGKKLPQAAERKHFSLKSVPFGSDSIDRLDWLG
jgi:hypothetical protein